MSFDIAQSAPKSDARFSKKRTIGPILNDDESRERQKRSMGSLPPSKPGPAPL